MCVGHGHPSDQALYKGQAKHKVDQGVLHNYGNNDTHTCPVSIEISSPLNLTIDDSSN